MEFLTERCYTALNAKELKIGSKVIPANNIDSLKCKVRDGDDIVEVREILIESYERRFLCNGGTFPFVYLVSEPVEKKLKWTDLKLGDVIRRKDGLREGLVTLIDKDNETTMHILAGTWLSGLDLEFYEKVE
jgi:hypothetical protein